MKRGGPIKRRTPMPRRPPGRKTGRKASAKRGLRRPPMDPRVRDAIYVRAGALCDLCGRFLPPDDYECHHRQLRSRGGTDAPENLIALHGECHSWVHGNPAAATHVGFMVPSWEDPAAVPIYRHGRAWQQPIEADWKAAAPIYEWSD